MTRYRHLVLAALVLAFGVIVLGAYVRLTHAGLGCPVWPGCYGKLTPHHAAQEIAQAQAAQPAGPVSEAKAWKEMVHRYFAGTLGLLVLGIFLVSFRNRAEARGSLGLPAFLLGLVVFQALLGMWTVTELLKPLVVTAHLLGGMSTLALLAWLWGVLHEFDTIVGVKEDVVDIILNVKKLRLRMHGSGERRLRIKKSGPRQVTAADIESDSAVEILNPDLLIATLDEGAHFEMEMIVKRGRGFIRAEQNKDENLPVMCWPSMPSTRRSRWPISRLKRPAWVAPRIMTVSLWTSTRTAA